MCASVFVFPMGILLFFSFYLFITFLVVKLSLDALTIVVRSITYRGYSLRLSRSRHGHVGLDLSPLPALFVEGAPIV